MRCGETHYDLNARHGCTSGYYVREGYECGHEMTIMQRCREAPQGSKGARNSRWNTLGMCVISPRRIFHRYRTIRNCVE